MPARPEFAAYRDGQVSDERMERLFGELAKAGVGRKNLYLAWDFTVASRDNPTERMLTIRDHAFSEVLGAPDFTDRKVAGEAPAFTVGVVTPRKDEWTDSRGVKHVQPQQWDFRSLTRATDWGHRGSSFVYWDTGNATSPNGNIPPTHADDPHGHPRNEPAAGWQEVRFLLTGENVGVCGGRPYLTSKHPENKRKSSCIGPAVSPVPPPLPP